MKNILFCLVFLTVSVFVSCGPDKNSPEYIAEQYMLSLKAKDWEKAKEFSDETGRDALDCIISLGNDSYLVEVDRIQDMVCETESDHGICSFCCSEDNKRLELNMIKEKEGWNVAGKKETCPNDEETIMGIESDSL